MKIDKYTPFIIPIFLIFIWWGMSVGKITDPLYLPLLSDVIDVFIKTFFIDGWKHLGATLYRTIVGFFIAGIWAIPLGILIGINKKVYRSLEIIIDFFRSIPATALFPMFLLFFGIGDGAKIALIIFICFWIILLNTIYGVWNAPTLRVKVAKVFKASRLQIIKDVVFWNALPQIMVGLRTALSLALIVVVVSEMFIGTPFGLGQKIYDSYITYQTDSLYAYTIIIGLLGYILNKLFVTFEEKVVHWTGK